MNFTDSEKIAIVSLLIEMANADGIVTYEEMIVFNLICRRLQVDHNAFIVAHALKAEHAMQVVKNMQPDKKRLMATLMVEIIDSDNVVDQREITLLNRICRQTGIDTLL